MNRPQPGREAGDVDSIIMRNRPFGRIAPADRLAAQRIGNGKEERPAPLQPTRCGDGADLTLRGRFDTH